MLARQRPWQARRRAGAEEGKDSPWSPRNLGNTRRLLRLARVISAPCSCTLRLPLHLPPTGSSPVAEGAARPAGPAALPSG